MSGGVLVFGSINIDLVCQADHIPRPGETILAPSYAVFPGGKGANQAVAAARAGAAVLMVGAVGNDAFAEIPRQALLSAGVNIAGLHSVEAPTGAAFITVSRDGENAITVASGANQRVNAAMIGSAFWLQSECLVLQGEIDPQENALAAQQAKARGLTVIFNAAPSASFTTAIMAHVDILIINEHEMADIAARHGLSGADGQIFARDILSTPTGSVIVTQGARGVAVYDAHGGWNMPVHAVDVIDTTGAGDTFVGVFAAMLAQGLSMREAVRLANIAAALACTRHGAQSAMPGLTEINAAEKAAGALG